MFNGQKLKDTRTDADLTQEQLAKLIGVKKKTVSAYETGTINPGIGTLIKIAEVLNVSIDYFVDLIDDAISYRHENYIELPKVHTKEIHTEMVEYLKFLKQKYRVK